MKIYTRAGDRGKTRIHGGARVDKDDIRIEANGTLDELNSLMGIVRACLPADHEWQSLLFRIQSEMMTMMSHVATRSADRGKNQNPLNEELVAYFEEQIDRLTGQMGACDYFLLPGGTLVSSYLHLARTVARRAERRLWTLNRQDEVPECILRCMNRLSDLFFVMARYEMYIHGEPEERWKTFFRG